MKAISIRQPWAFAICYFGKRVENRDWDLRGGNIAQARRLVGSDILIHAAKGCTRDEWDDACEFMASFAHPHDGPKGVTIKTVPRGLIVATAKLVAVVRTLDNGCRVPANAGGSACSFCHALHLYTACPNHDPWAIPGTVGLILDDVRPLPRPVPFKGALGFFEVPDGAPCGER